MEDSVGGIVPAAAAISGGIGASNAGMGADFSSGATAGRGAAGKLPQLPVTGIAVAAMGREKISMLFVEPSIRLLR